MNELTRSISLTRGTGILVTTLLGTGVFVLPQITVEIAGKNALFAWAILIAAMLPVTLVFARLCTRLTHASGPAYFLEKAFGISAGKTIALMYLLMVPVGAPAAIEITAEFLHAMVPMSRLQILLFELLLLVLIYLMNRRGISLSASLQTTLTITVLIVIGAMLFAQFQSPITLPSAAPTNLANLPSAMALAFWSFIGIETMSHLSEEFKNPQRDYGRALLLGLVIVGLIYLSCTWLIWSYTGPVNNSLVLVDVFNHYFGHFGQYIIGTLGLLSGLATVNIYVASTARLGWSLAREGHLPKAFGKVNRHNTPTFNLALVLSSMAIVLVLAHAFRLDYESLIRWTNGVAIFIYAYTILASFKLLPKKFWFSSATASVVCVLLLASLGHDVIYAVLLQLFVFSLVRINARMKKIFI